MNQIIYYRSSLIALSNEKNNAWVLSDWLKQAKTESRYINMLLKNLIGESKSKGYIDAECNFLWITLLQPFMICHNDKLTFILSEILNLMFISW